LLPRGLTADFPAAIIVPSVTPSTSIPVSDSRRTRAGHWDAPPQPTGRWAWWLFVAALATFNSNGREIASYDSQPTKFAARELALHGRLTLDEVVAAAPALGQRHSFQKDRAGHFRSAYSVVPSIEAAALGWLLHHSRLVDLRAPLAPALVASLTASLLTAAAVTLVFLAVARRTSRLTALAVAVGLAVGTNLWPLASRALWQIETVTFGLALALHAWWRPREMLLTRHVVVGACGLALAGTARLETAPMLGLLLAGLAVRIGVRRASGAAFIVGAAAVVTMVVQYEWFGSVLGAKMRLQETGFAAHGVTGTFSPQPWLGAVGLLVSPSRGLLVFSPVVLIALLGIPTTWRGRSDAGDGWWTSAAVLQYCCYACYSMWWGGHTYGPRYLLDALVPLVPAAAAGMSWVTLAPWRRAAAALAFAWSVAAAATGAFCFPHDGWNTAPRDVDRHHERLWEWRDPQILRAWQRGPSPQNFGLVDPEALRPAPPGHP
jgi:hypothetical protein